VYAQRREPAGAVEIEDVDLLGIGGLGDDGLEDLRRRLSAADRSAAAAPSSRKVRRRRRRRA
jgi:hypothetical protein